MKIKAAYTVFLTAVSLTLSACGSPQMSAEETTAELSPTVKDSSAGRGVAVETNVETEANREEIKTTESPKETFLTVDKILELSGREDLTWTDFEFFKEHAHTNEYVGIRGHVKEIRGNEILVSSDTDDFPGIFWIGGIETLAAEEELKGGTPVFVLMEDTGRQAADGLEQFRAKQFVALSEDEEEGKAVIRLLSAPALTLTDALSSRYELFEIWPGNSSWSVVDSGEVTSIVACGAAPLDEMSLKAAPRLKLPAYYMLDEVYYSFSTTVAPDKLVIRRWNLEDITDAEAVPECVIIYYCPVFGVNLMKGKVYEFAAEWNEENLEQTGFGGRASYVLVTE